MQKTVPESPDMFNIRGVLLRSEPMWRHSTFGVGGPADYYAVPEDADDLAVLRRAAADGARTSFVLGGGSNILVSDKGIRGLVIDTRKLSGFALEDGMLILGAGLEVSEAAWRSGSLGRSGLHVFFGMPGSVGGALWMNARCYGGEISEMFEWAEVMDPRGRIERIVMDPGAWSYKRSPFQVDDRPIIRCALRTEAGDPDELRAFMRDTRDDRESKGHYRAPCAGSAFKNDRRFGEPSGALIDRCGLKGRRIGGAAVSAWHGNIVVNDGGASARDVMDLLQDVRDRVETMTGFRMEPEVLPVGDWPEDLWAKS